ncbi:MAG TPA: Ppx/GppA family phosphatase [Solirubrobacteraceae bacterium]|nr:Ppx/GppA family phosphatase [Solirubrobacteraceae bacterium]
MTRVAVVDLGSNSTRLLVADVTPDGIAELDRRSIVTRLGEGVEATGRLGAEPQARVLRVLDEYAQAIDRHGAGARIAVLTSAVRDAANGAAFTEEIRRRYGLDARTLSGDEEARLTFLGATAARPHADGPLLVVDIGGGSTEIVSGTATGVGFHVSTQIGVVRHSERHLHHDPPHAEELEALAADVRATVEREVPADVRAGAPHVIAVAGTATMAAAMDLELEPYDAARVEGHRLSLDALRARLAQLASVPVAERARTPGLHPERAPTIVAGVAILIEVLEAFGAGLVEVSDRDILWGCALENGR